MTEGHAIYSIYLDDVDAFGIMHHFNFFRYLVRARTDWLQERGYKYNDLLERGINFVLKKADIEFLNPAKVYDQMEIITSVHSRRKVSQVYKQIVRDYNNPNVIFCRGFITVVCVNEQLKPREFPNEILEELP